MGLPWSRTEARLDGTRVSKGVLAREVREAEEEARIEHDRRARAEAAAWEARTKALEAGIRILENRQVELEHDLRTRGEEGLGTSSKHQMLRYEDMRSAPRYRSARADREPESASTAVKRLKAKDAALTARKSVLEEEVALLEEQLRGEQLRGEHELRDAKDRARLKSAWESFWRDFETAQAQPGPQEVQRARKTLWHVEALSTRFPGVGGEAREARDQLDRLARTAQARELQVEAMVAEATGLDLRAGGPREVVAALLREEVLVRVKGVRGELKALEVRAGVFRVPAAALSVLSKEAAIEVVLVTDDAEDVVEAASVLAGGGMALEEALEAARAF
jgi:hypothetical protein